MDWPHRAAWQQFQGSATPRDEPTCPAGSAPIDSDSNLLVESCSEAPQHAVPWARGTTLRQRAGEWTNREAAVGEITITSSLVQRHPGKFTSVSAGVEILSPARGLRPILLLSRPKRFTIFARSRPRKEVALPVLPAETTKRIQLLLAVNPFSDAHHAHRVAEVTYLLDQQRAVCRVWQLRGERNVKLQMVEREPTDVGDRRERGAEVIQRQAHSKALDPPEEIYGLPRVTEKDRLGYLDDEIDGI